MSTKNLGDVLFSVKSTYQADLTDDQREWCENQIQEAHRTGFYELTPAECQIVNQHTLENLELGVLLMTVPGNINALGLVLQRAEYEPTLDEEGDPVLNEEGDPVLKLIAEGPYDVTINVKQEGFKDAEGNLIKKGKQNFLVTGQATNRPRNENNWKKYLLKRMTKWMLNGEALIRDLNNCGITEQHRRLAYVVGILEGILDPNYQVFSVFVNGVHPLAAITADTGKPNSATDIIASDPLIVPPSIQVDSVTILNNDPNGNKTFVEDRVKHRVRACTVTQGVAKSLLLRMQGKNVNANLGVGQMATELAHTLVSEVMPDIDDIATACHTIVLSLPSYDGKYKVCTATELATAICLYEMKEHDYHIDSRLEPKSSKVDYGKPLADCEQIRFSLDKYIPFLAELGTMSGQLSEWSQRKCSREKREARKEIKFAWLLLALDKFMKGETVDKSLLTESAIGGNQSTNVKDGKGYYHLGGLDRGMIQRGDK